jgi:hypothetical protein
MIALNLEWPFYFAIMRDMATALTALHWAAGTDAKGVKFVICGQRRSHRQDTATTNHDQLSLWEFNFEKPGYIPLCEHGVAMAVDAYMNNDPYYLRPFQYDNTAKYVWLVFKEAYLIISKTLLSSYRSCRHKLPALFTKGIEDRLRDRK